MQTTNESSTEQACREAPPAELQAVQGGSSLSEWEVLALYRQSMLNHGILYTVQPGQTINVG
jgi:hypothetical protein